MKKIATLLVGAMLMMGITGAVASATTINYTSVNTPGDKTSAYSYLQNFEVETFNNVAIGPVPTAGLLWSWSGNASVLGASISGQSATPFGDTTKFISVPNPRSNGSVTVTLGGLYDYFGLWWGSVDSYNTLSFYNGTTQVASFTGSQVINPSAANGNQTAPSTNLYVNFIDLPDFNSFRMASTQFAFEADNIAIGNVVPEPGTMMLLGIGMFGLAVYGKRRMNKDA